MGSEVRANYFADLSVRYRRTNRAITWLILLFSSGAVWFAAGGMPVELSWVRIVAPCGTAALSLWLLVAQHSQRATDCEDLHFQWNTLALAYETLWGDQHAIDAANRLISLRERGAELSKRSTHLPNRRASMLKWEGHVVAEHRHMLSVT